MFLQVLDGVFVIHSPEGTFGRLEVRVDFLEEVGQGSLHDAVDHVTHEIFQAIQQIVEGDERTLGLDVRVPNRNEKISLIVNRSPHYSLGQMSSCTRLFCSV